MRVVFLARARRDLVWWHTYYGSVFPEGKDNASRQFEKTIGLISSNPFLGRPVGERELREYSIPRMPFSLIYRIDGDVLQVARVVDQRSNRRRDAME